jgi:hypothetical protein
MTISRNLSFLAEGVSSTGVLGASNGGSGASTLTGYLYGNGTSAFTASTTIPTTALSGTISNAQLANSSLTVNGTSISLGGSGTVTAAAGTLTGTTLNSTVVSSSLTSVGTISTGVWNGTAITVPYGGTGQTSFTANQILYGNGTSGLSSSSNFVINGVALGIGTNNPSPYTSGDSILDIYSTSYASELRLRNATGTNGLLLDQSGKSSYIWNVDNSFISFGVNNGEVARIHASGGVSIGNTTDPGAGNLRFATAGTNGIYFGSSARLDDYQQGTWTPKLSDGTNTVNLSGGYYIKVGKLVTIFVNSYNTSMAGLSTSANLFINNLPFTPTQDSLVAWNPTLYVAAQFFNMYLSAANNKIYVYRNSSTIDYTGVPLIVFGSPSNMSWFFSMSYTA